MSIYPQLSCRLGSETPALTEAHESLQSICATATILPRESQDSSLLLQLVTSGQCYDELVADLLDEPEYARQGFTMATEALQHAQILARAIVNLRQDLLVDIRVALNVSSMVRFKQAILFVARFVCSVRQ